MAGQEKREATSEGARMRVADDGVVEDERVKGRLEM